MNLKYQIERLGNEVGFLIQNWGILWVYQSNRERPKYVTMMNEYLDFFKTGIRAHMHELIIGLYKIWDTNPGNITIHRLYKEAEASGKLSPKSKEKFRNFKKKRAATIKKVMLLRSNVFAHFSSTLSFDEVFLKARLSHDEIRALIYDTYGLIYRCSVDVLNTTLPNYSSYGTIKTTRRLMDALNKGIHQDQD